MFGLMKDAQTDEKADEKMLEFLANLLAIREWLCFTTTREFRRAEEVFGLNVGRGSQVHKF